MIFFKKFMGREKQGGALFNDALLWSWAERNAARARWLLLCNIQIVNMLTGLALNGDFARFYEQTRITST
jgi:hypothetical protein